MTTYQIINKTWVVSKDNNGVLHKVGNELFPPKMVKGFAIMVRSLSVKGQKVVQPYAEVGNNKYIDLTSLKIISSDDSVQKSYSNAIGDYPKKSFPAWAGLLIGAAVIGGFIWLGSLEKI